jgi:hypothetical protein
MSVQYGGDKITFSDGSTVGSGWTGFKNRIINGAMMISQRGTSFAGLTNGGGAYTLDRWAWSESGASTAVQTVSQDSSAPVGFVDSLKVLTTTAQASLASSNSYRLGQAIEGYNISDLGWGTANAQPVTLSFWVRSSLTGTFGGNIVNGAGNRFYVFSYSINLADTWEYKTVTITGDTSGTWATDNSSGIVIQFSMGAGSDYLTTAGSWGSSRVDAPTGQVNVAGTLNATFYITGVQLEKGSTATSFDYRPYGTELALCQRYFEKSYNQSIAVGAASGGSGSMSIVCCGNTNRAFGNAVFKASKRADPTVTFYSTEGTSGNFRNTSQGTNIPVSVASNAGEGQASIVCSSGIVSVTDTMLGFFTASSEL